MMLQQVIHFPDTNSVEATWVVEASPAIDVPESIAPDTMDEVGNVIPGAVTPAHTIPAVFVQAKCHSYADVQMDMLEADLGGDAAQYANLIATVRAGIVPFVPPPPQVPQSVTMRQARLALLGAGLLASVNEAIAVMPGVNGEAARIEWEYAQVVERNAGLVPAMAVALGMTEAQIDGLFLVAVTL
jgi:hypothetical protein